jgi:hypothetical protein
MRKSNKKTDKQVEETQLKISASIDEALLLTDLVEKLAHRRINHEYTRELMPSGWQAIETSSLEAFVSGNVNVSGEGDQINTPFVTCFLFTCVKAKKDEYTLTWSSSLS